MGNFNWKEHCASSSKPTLGYGNIDLGIEVAMYRASAYRAAINAGKNAYQADKEAESAVIAKYGKPTVYS